MKKIILFGVSFCCSLGVVAAENNLTGYNYFDPNLLYYEAYYPGEISQAFTPSVTPTNTIGQTNYEIYDSNLNYLNQLPAPAYGVKQFYTPKNSFDYYNYYQKTYSPEYKKPLYVE